MKLSKQVNQISLYLIGQYPSEMQIAEFSKAIESVDALKMSEKQEKVWQMHFKKKWKINALDHYLGFTSPNHPIRQRIFFMFCLLECDPKFSTYFLPKKTNLIQLIGHAMLAGLHLLYLIPGWFLIKKYHD